ncbi:hypothetical protein DCS_04513 [Drechmeria coniospora]|uniref:Uncharacterized protein n=1 Tax=Drechmeria coniospora TaxID=98403 RepID=A0A151GK57_DRECN|nr:hypothetical protein DCS_04513 [Drechmeria coniospora]KYK57503.1 hypothetical protein DCS_04513 [Drechmeria coniospora]
MAPRTRAAALKKVASKRNAGVANKREIIKAAKLREDQLQDQLIRLKDKYIKANNEGKQQLKSQLQKKRKLVDNAVTTHIELDYKIQNAVINKPNVIKPEGNKSVFPTGRNSGSQPNNQFASEENDDDDDDKIGLVHAIGDINLNQTPGKLEIFFNGGFGQYYGVSRHGPTSRARYTINHIAKTYEDLPNNLRNDPSINLDKITRIQGRASALKGKIYCVLAVAWKHVREYDRMLSLAPDSWTRVRQGAIRQAPTIVIKVWWDSEVRPVSWEKRGPVKKVIYPGAKQDAFRVPKTIKYSTIIILEKDTNYIHKADHLIINTAVRQEKRH